MIRILAYTAPLTMPFVVLGVLRAMFFLAGAEWVEPVAAVIVSFCVGIVIGYALAFAYWVEMSKRNDK